MKTLEELSDRAREIAASYVHIELHDASPDMLVRQSVARTVFGAKRLENALLKLGDLPPDALPIERNVARERVLRAAVMLAAEALRIAELHLSR